MILVFFTLLMVAIGVPIAVESKFHPEQNVLIGLREAAENLAWGAVLISAAAYLLSKIFNVAMHFVVRHL